ncbi:MAG: ATP-binding protein [Spirochaetales bacterium]|nr:ATP-binding protein [Spirochaetales bacterium]
MKEVVVISGKGGTGKTSITASFAVIGRDNIVVGDCDVDADDMHLLLEPDYKSTEDFYSGYTAVIDQEKCTACGKCMDVCRFKAVDNKIGKFEINSADCEGCGYCCVICPEKAITMQDAYVGEVFISGIKTGTEMVHARLKAGADNSGKLVARVKKIAGEIAKKDGKDLILIDGSPGIGCPVISSLSGADFVILVTEPTPSGIHDLKRVFELIQKFKIRSGLIINKHDLNLELSAELKDFAKNEGIKVLAEIPYEPDFTKAMTEGFTVVEYNNKTLKKILTEAWAEAEKEIYKEVIK